MNEIKPIKYFYKEYLSRLEDSESYVEWSGYQSILNRIEAMINCGIRYTTLNQIFNYTI